MAKLDMAKLNTTESAYAKTNILRERPKTEKPAALAEKKEISVVPAVKAEEKKEERTEEKKPAEMKAEENVNQKAVVEKPVVKETIVPTEKRGKGRPPKHPMKLDEEGQRLININVLMPEKMQDYLAFVAKKSKVSKADYVKQLVQADYESHTASYEAYLKAMS